MNMLLYPENLKDVQKAIKFYEANRGEGNSYELELAVLNELAFILSFDHPCEVNDEIYEIYTMNQEKAETEKYLLNDILRQIDEALDQKNEQAFYELATVYKKLKKQFS